MPLAQTTIIDQKPSPMTPPKRQAACIATSSGRPRAASECTSSHFAMEPVNASQRNFLRSG